MRFCVYDLIGPDGDVLYVGFTWNLTRRLGTHVRNGLCPEGTRIVDVEWFDDMIAVREAETARIEALRPPLNKLGNRMPQEQAEEIWFSDFDVPNRVVLERMPGWSLDAAYRVFGPRTLTTAAKRLGPRGSKPGRKINLDSG